MRSAVPRCAQPSLFSTNLSLQSAHLDSDKATLRFAFCFERSNAATTSDHSSACDFRPAPSCRSPRVPGSPQFGEQASLFILHEVAGDPAPHFAAEVVAVGQIVARGKSHA